MNYENRLNVAIERIKELDNKENSEKIIEFLDDLQFERISAVRRLGYAQKLRRIATILEDKFLVPTERDIKNVVREIMSTPVQRGGRRNITGEENDKAPTHKPTENTVSGYLVALKRFYK